MGKHTGPKGPIVERPRPADRVVTALKTRVTAIEAQLANVHATQTSTQPEKEKGRQKEKRRELRREQAEATQVESVASSYGSESEPESERSMVRGGAEKGPPTPRDMEEETPSYECESPGFREGSLKESGLPQNTLFEN